MSLPQKRTVLFLTVYCLLFCPVLYSQKTVKPVQDYFEDIRNNEAELTAFISQMPKGADLHNHYSGSIYAESYVDWLTEAGYCVNPQTLQTFAGKSGCPQDYSKLADLKSNSPSYYETIRNNLIRYWSAKDYDQIHTLSREDQFFTAFGKFGAASGMNYDKGLAELKDRAKKENVSYIELMFSSIWMPDSAKNSPFISNADTLKFYNTLFAKLTKSRDSAATYALLKSLYPRIYNKVPVNTSAALFNSYVDSLHTNFVGEDPSFTMRYLTYVSRINDPLITFINMMIAFEAAQYSQHSGKTLGLLRGVNILAPEDNSNSMQNYWLHMQFFSFCNKQYKGMIPYTMHAGELTEGVVPPEELTWHISSAVRSAGAKRIGHGVDIAYEKDNYGLLNYMRTNSIAVEINLSSNEFILGIKDDKHPILLYKHFGVPIVISTDDAGISRSSLTEQYVLLAKRYKEISYADIKQFVYNSILYSFLDAAKKEALRLDLDKRFTAFETYITNR